MNIARIRFPRNEPEIDYEKQGEVLENLRMALKARPDTSCAVMLDTEGPCILTGGLKDNKKIPFTKGHEFTISSVETFEDLVEGDINQIYCNYPALA